MRNDLKYTDIYFFLWYRAQQTDGNDRPWPRSPKNFSSAIWTWLPESVSLFPVNPERRHRWFYGCIVANLSE